MTTNCYKLMLHLCVIQLFVAFHGFMEYRSTNGSFKTQDMSLSIN